LCVSGRFVSPDCGDGELQKETRQALGGILLIGRLGSLPTQVAIWQANQHHLQHIFRWLWFTDNEFIMNNNLA